MDSNLQSSGDTIGLSGELRQQYVSDVAELGKALGAWFAVYEQLTPGPFQGSTHELWIGDGVEVLWETGSQTIFTTGRNKPGTSTIGVPVPSAQTGIYCGTSLKGVAVAYLPGGTEFEILARGKFDIVSATIDTALLASFATELGETLHTDDLHERPSVLARTNEAGVLRQALLEIICAVDANPDLLKFAGTRNAMRDCVLTIALGLLGRRTYGDKWRLPRSHKCWLVRSVRDYVLSHADETPSLASLCAHFGVSQRSLQYAFVEHTGMSVARFLRHTRLNAVHRAIVRSTALGDGESIAALAARWGFWHPPRFAIHYRELFGELPSESRRRGSKAFGP